MDYTVNVADRQIVNQYLSGMSYAGRLVNPEAIDYTGHYNPDAHVIVNEFGVLAVVFGMRNYQDALDAAVDAGKMNCQQLQPDDEAYCMHCSEWHSIEAQQENCEFASVSFLGNASEPFDMDYVNMFEMPASAFLLDPEVIEAIGPGLLGQVLYQVRSAKSEAIQTDYESNDERNDWLVYSGAIQFLEEHMRTVFPTI